MLALITVFCSLVAVMLYGAAGEPSGGPAVAAVVATYLFPASIALWVYRDVARRGSHLAYDFDSLVFFTWPVAAPVYLLRTQGTRGCGVIILFVLVFVALTLVDLALM